MTFMGGVGPIVQMGAQPIFFDLDEDSWTIDCDLLEEALEKSSVENTLPRAIIPTDLYGQAADISRIVGLGKKYGVLIISDSAEAVGAFRGETHAGRGATSTVFSFNGNKIITSSGGGMLMSDDPELIVYARKLSTQSRENCIHYEHKEIGYNYRLSNISAAIGLGQLEGIEQKVSARRRIYEKYREAFQNLQAISFMPEPEGCRSTRWLSCMTIDPAQSGISPLDVYKKCEENKIEVRPLWKPMHMQPVFEGTTFVGSGVCERLFAEGLCLPSGSGMSDDQQQRVIEVISDIFQNG